MEARQRNYIGSYYLNELWDLGIMKEKYNFISSLQGREEQKENNTILEETTQE